MRYYKLSEAYFTMDHTYQRFVEQGAEFGMGAMQQGVWYFAFGANLSAAKLTGSRGINPLEAVPGELRGWRLAFNHR